MGAVFLLSDIINHKRSLEAIGINTLKFGLFSQPFPKRVQIGLPSLRFGPYYLSPND